jgi:hypothetical protein
MVENIFWIILWCVSGVAAYQIGYARCLDHIRDRSMRGEYDPRPLTFRCRLLCWLKNKVRT